MRKIIPFAIACAIAVSACKKDSAFVDTSPVVGPNRTFRMGFSGYPPRFDFNIAVAAINMWSTRADAAIISYEPPWDSLLTGILPESLLVRNESVLVRYFRAKGLALWVYLDPGNGLNRAGESDPLVRHGRSMTEPAIQQMYRRYVVVADSILHPDHLGLALETNLIRGSAPALLYSAIRQVVNDAAADVRARDATVKLSVSVQVDYAWGRLGGTYQGVGTDFVDFPFIQELGLSSYPYLAGYSAPEDVPLDYYTRLVQGRSTPVMVTEGGWTSVTLDSIVSSPELQRRYIIRQTGILDSARAIAVFQLTFTDIDLVASPPPPGSIIPLFAHLGLVDINLNPKPALSAWDSIFARMRNP